MTQTFKEQRIAGYQNVLKENKNETAFEKTIKEKIFKWWAEWIPDYEGWCRIAEWLYAPHAQIKAIGDAPQDFQDYEKSMKGQRDFFTMDMGPIEEPVVEGDTIAFHYSMYLTPKMDMNSFVKGKTMVIEVTEFNTFGHENEANPQVMQLTLMTTQMKEAK